MTNHALAAIVLVGALLLLLVQGVAGRGEAAPGCHALILPEECRQIQARFRQAKDTRQRQAVEAAYRELISERERLCPKSKESGETRPVQPIQVPEHAGKARSLML